MVSITITGLPGWDTRKELNVWRINSHELYLLQWPDALANLRGDMVANLRDCFSLRIDDETIGFYPISWLEVGKDIFGESPPHTLEVSVVLQPKEGRDSDSCSQVARMLFQSVQNFAKTWLSLSNRLIEVRVEVFGRCHTGYYEGTVDGND